MKVMFCTNLPSPYRVDFFNELGRYCDLTVCYERQSSTERDDNWVGDRALRYKEVYLDLTLVGPDRSRGGALQEYISKYSFDILLLTNYISPAVMRAIMYCKWKKIPYWIEYDGGFNKKDSFIKRQLKRFLLCGAQKHLTTCDEHIEYLKSLGIPWERIRKYPFSSVFQDEILRRPLSESEKNNKKKELRITEPRMVISVGRFNYQNGKGKGFDNLFRVAEKIDQETGFYIIGDEPTEEFVNWKKQKGLEHIHFIPFKKKRDLFEYYQAADIMVLLTRGDTWGLVVNEAMACGLPVVTTERCMAGVEMIQDGKNGRIVFSETYEEALKAVGEILDSNRLGMQMAKESLATAKKYTIEEMAKAHKRFFEEIQ